jgi:hypothetical protein
MKLSTQVENPAINAAAYQVITLGAVPQVPIGIKPTSNYNPLRRSLFGKRCLGTASKGLAHAWCCTLLLAALGLYASSSAHAQTVTFDFDTGAPAPTPGKTTPFSYDSGGVTAIFSSATANGFSVQNVNSVPGADTLSLFSGLFLNPNSTERATLRIKFSQAATNISLVFATAQSTAVEIPNPVTLSAYLDSTTNRVGSPLTVPGVWRVGSVTEAYPSAALTFTSDAQHPFNLIEILLAPGGAGGVMVDNISIQPAPVPAEPTLQSSAALGAPFADDLTSTVDGGQKTVMVEMNGTRQFYRLRSTVSSRITQIRTVGSQVVLNYE